MDYEIVRQHQISFSSFALNVFRRRVMTLLHLSMTSIYAIKAPTAAANPPNTAAAPPAVTRPAAALDEAEAAAALVLEPDPDADEP